MRDLGTVVKSLRSIGVLHKDAYGIIVNVDDKKVTVFTQHNKKVKIDVGLFDNAFEELYVETTLAIFKESILFQMTQYDKKRLPWSLLDRNDMGTHVCHYKGQELHNEYGFAVEWLADSQWTNEYYLNGVQKSEEEWLQATTITKFRLI